MAGPRRRRDNARMSHLDELLQNNRNWAERIQAEDPGFFERLSKQQTPKFLWVGCSDSRVPANQIVDLAPGEVFVHRNIANVVVHTDLNCLSVIQFAVDVLKVEHILVVGHYGCGGVLAALQGARLGLVDNWIRHVTDVAHKHAPVLDAAGGDTLRHDRLCELNVLEQVANVCHTTIVRDAWSRGQSLTVHGWVYTLRDGRVHDLGLDIDGTEAFPSQYAGALERIRADREDR
jgi:carbonic anhydrase